MKITTRKKIRGSLLMIVALQIFLLVNMSFANSYLIHKTDLQNYKIKIINNEKIKKTLSSGLNLLIGFLTIKQIRSVSAQNDDLEDLENLQQFCCEKTKSGAICQDVSSIDWQESCTQSNLIQTSCEESSVCRKGCCFDAVRGSCSPGSTQAECENNGGQWDDDDACLTQECQKGCCVLGSQALFRTEKECEFLSAQRGVEKDFRDYESEPECIALAVTMAEGACILEGNTCRFATEKECVQDMNGRFYEGVLCSNPTLNTNCEKQDSIGCVEEENEIYWKDSCGNRENIYDSNKDRSWNNGRVLKKSESCGANSDNINSRTCGNCARELSSVCSATESGETHVHHVQDGDYVCKNLGCEDAEIRAKYGRNPRDKESWCVYEGPIGKITEEPDWMGRNRTYGSDLVGSEHWMKICEEGEIKMLTEGYGRNKICQQSNIGPEEENPYFIRAVFVTNEATICLSLNPMQEVIDDKLTDIEDQIQKCEGNTHCFVKIIDVTRRGSFDKTCIPDPTSNPSEEDKARCLSMDLQNFGDDGLVFGDDAEKIILCEADPKCKVESEEHNKRDNFKYKMCVPRYPPGADLMDDSGADENLCSVYGSATCKVVYQKNWRGKWKCKSNCECKQEKFAREMNDLCISIGDCGSYVNYIGDGADNVEIIGRKGKEIKDEKESDKDSSKAETPPGIYSWEHYLSQFNSVGEGKVTPQPFKTYMEKFGYSGYGNSVEERENAFAEDMLNLGGKVAGVSGALYATSLLPGILTSINIVGPVELFKSIYLGVSGWSPATPLGTGVIGTISAVAVAVVAAYIGAVVSSKVASALGISGTPNAIIAILTAIGVFILTLTYLGVLNGWNPVGWVALALAALTAFFSAITGWGDMETRVIDFKCEPWTAPYGGENCEKCNEDPLKPCTEYRCESLGQSCVLENEDIVDEDPVCLSMQYETNPPQLYTSEISEGYEFVGVDGGPNNFTNGNKIIRIESTTRDDGCIQEWEEVSFKLNSDEPAQCKWSFVKPSSPLYEEMIGEYSGGNSALRKIHRFTFMMPSISSLDPNQISGDIREWYGDVKMYIKCQDGVRAPDGTEYPNFNHDVYTINFCANSEPDSTAVDHSKTVINPESGAYIQYGVTEVPMKMWLNEPAECKYDIAPGKSYYDMANMLNCVTDINRREFYGWLCETTLTNLTKGDNNFYFKCRDQPWLGDNESRQINSQDFAYTLHGSASELRIDGITLTYENQVIIPEGTIVNGFEPITLELGVATFGGAYNGVAECSWGVFENGNRVSMYETFSNTHKQTLTNRMGGAYKFYIECEDEAGNKAEAEATFYISIDTIPPIVTRAYKDGSSLKILTNEQAKCYYNFERCNFNLENGTSMTTALSTSHSASWIDGKTYHIKCEDLWENKNPECAIKIKT